MTDTIPSGFRRFFQNKEGEIVIWQFPNVPLWGGIIFTGLARIVRDTGLHDGLHHLSSAFFFTWAYLEIRYGESMFRKILGVAVLVNVVASYFR